MKAESFDKTSSTGLKIVDRLGKLAPRFLEGLPPDDLAVVLRASTLKRFHARSIIANEGEPADRMFLLLEGLARTFSVTGSGEKVVLLWVPAGEVAAGRALLSKPTDYLVTTETVTDCTALMWTRSAIQPLSLQYPRLLQNALLIASDYLAAYRDLHIGASYDSASIRVAKVLNKLARGMGRRGFEGIVINISNEELANEANVTIFTVSRLLSEWHRNGLLVKSRGRVMVLSPEELIRRAG
jgi:CRP/FNR family transcriptional regulator, nitrogen oxide reductase regulator